MDSNTSAAAHKFVVVDPRSAVALASMRSYFGELADRFDDGFDPGDTLERDAPNFEPPNGVFVVASDPDGAALGCGAVQLLPDGAGEVKRMWVAKSARGRGLGKSVAGRKLEGHALAPR